MLLGVTFLIAILGLWDVISSYVDSSLFFILLVAGIASTSFFAKQEANKKIKLKYLMTLLIKVLASLC